MNEISGPQAKTRENADECIGREIPSVSVVIPNYNHGEHIAAAVKATAEQSARPDEIIVVDDGSTDNSLDVLEKLGRIYPALRVVVLPTNQGAINALNRGLLEARSTYVYFGAADDFAKPKLFETMLDVAFRYPNSAFVCGEAEIVDIDTGKVSVRPPVRPSFGPRYFSPFEVNAKFRQIDNWMLTGAALIRRDFALEVGGFDPALGALADGYLFRRLAFLHGCCFIPFSGLVWQIRASGLSRTQAASPAAGLAAVEAAVRMMRADPAFPSWYPELFERRWRFAVCRLAAQAKPMNTEVLSEAGARGLFGRQLIAASATIGGPVGRFVALTWLTLRQRPTSLSGLFVTYLSRRLPLAQRALHNYFRDPLEGGCEPAVTVGCPAHKRTIDETLLAGDAHTQ